jgi:glycerol-3-phosphate dehydrogenase (NAD(P)+)
VAALQANRNSAPITVIGAGSWGTALAIQFARVGRPVKLWGRNTDQLKDMQATRSNARYLPGIDFPESLQVELDLQTALDDCTDILIAAPSHSFRELLLQLKSLLPANAKLAWATKGFELQSGKLPHQVVAEVLGPNIPMAVLSGPTFAKEVGAGLPTAMTVASSDADYAMELAHSISGHRFRAYTSTDLIGVEVGGAVKNVLAIGTGMSDGLGFGANTRIALITRGLVEMTRLGMALGAQRETFMGLAGLGDLVLTCTDNQSRNRRFGLAFAAGTDTTVAQQEIGQVVEGVAASRAVMTVAKQHKVDMPICTQVYRTLHEGLAPATAVKELMSRDIKAEVS